jgi:hypothetical protein
MSVTGVGVAPTTTTTDQQSIFDKQMDTEFSQLLDGADDSDPAKMLQDITSGGFDAYWKWQIKQEEAELTAQVMKSMNLTKAQIDAMPANQRAETEAEIIKAVQQRLEIWMKEQQVAQLKKADGSSGLASDTAGALLAATELDSTTVGG